MELEELQSSPRFAKRCFECFARRTYVNMKKSFLPSNKRPFALTVDPTVAECIARQGFHLHILRGKTWLESLLVARALETRLRMFIMLNTLDVAPRTVFSAHPFYSQSNNFDTSKYSESRRIRR